ncbi:hypothetical protein, partial [Treponema sp.]|uniref:hypothetical protein n=1 Tax=Treponema sp. TaxID=166 RepID=UPI00298DFA78
MVDSVDESVFCQVNLCSILRYLISLNDEECIVRFLKNKNVLEGLAKDTDVTPMLAFSFEKNEVKNILMYFSKENIHLNFSNNASCLENALGSESIESVKWVLSNGVSINTELDFLGEKCSPVEYTKELIHRLNYDDNDVRVKQSRERLNEILLFLESNS